MRFVIALAAVSAVLTGCGKRELTVPAELLTTQQAVGGGTIFSLKTYRPLWVSIRPSGPTLDVNCEDGSVTSVFVSATLEPPQPPPLRGIFASFSGVSYSWKPEMSYLHKTYWLVGRDGDQQQRAALVKDLAAGPLVMTAETGWGLGDTLEWRLPDTPLAADFRRQCAGA